MAGGPVFPASVYVGGASGNLSATFYVPSSNTNNAGAIEGIGVVASLSTEASAVLQFNLPESLPTGTAKIRTLSWANASTGTAKWTVFTGVSSGGQNIGAATLTSAATQNSQAWSAADVIVENKTTIATTLAANQVMTCLITYNSSGWSLAATSVHQHSLVWE